MNATMHRKYNLMLILIQIVTMQLGINCVESNLLERLRGMTLTKNFDEKESLKKEADNVLSTGQIFQDIFSEHLAPFEIEFGHVCENPSEWEQRFERKNFDINRHSGKVKWGNKRGEYGEHYWDLNH